MSDSSMFQPKLMGSFSLADTRAIGNVQNFNSSYDVLMDSLVMKNISSSFDASLFCVDECRYLYRSAAEMNTWLLFWVKQTTCRIILNYMSSPLALVFLPLCVGILTGWLLGCRATQGKRTHKKRWKCFFSTLRRLILKPFSSAYQCITIFPKLCLDSAKYLAREMNEEHYSSFTGIGKKLKEEHGRVDHAAEATRYESGIARNDLPRHIAVIMDGNRRYGRERYGIANKGHWDGSKKVFNFASWCQEEGIEVLTVYAFSTENWKRAPKEVAALMEIILKNCDKIRDDALRKGWQIRILSTDKEKISDDVRRALKKVEEDTSHCNNFILNICLSYGSRGDIVNACKSVINDIQNGIACLDDVTEDYFGKELLGGDCPDPDILIRTSGELRLSNFQLWQIAYTELFFMDCKWPEIEKDDLIDVIRKYAHGRNRRYGK